MESAPTKMWTGNAGGSAAVFLALIGLLVRGVEPQSVSAAQLQRQVMVPTVSKMDPVVVKRVTVGNATVQAGRFRKPPGEARDEITPFTADDDWVQNTTVYLLNRTNRAVVYFQVNVSFPETTAGTRRANVPLLFGQLPASEAFTVDGKPARAPAGIPMSFGPGQVMAIHLADHMDRINARMDRAIPVAAVSSIAVVVASPFFADGLWYNDGQYWSFDKVTSTWRRINPNYFPGDIDSHWPGRPGWDDAQ